MIIEGPTGFGKSPVNIALGRYFKPTFYTTPQKQLVNQIVKDFGPEELAVDGGQSDIMGLLGRKNYICKVSNKPSDKCNVRNNKDEKCSDHPNCTYWAQKLACMRSDVAVITFAMLIVNRYLSFSSPDAAFMKRNLLIVDEVHSLEGQVASMFAGFSVSPFSFPKSFRNIIWQEIEKIQPNTELFSEEHTLFLEQVNSKCSSYRPNCHTQKELEKLDSLSRKIDYLLEEVKELNRKWVVNVITSPLYSGHGLQYKPIWIDRFLQRMVWSQTDKILLTSATIPFRENPQKWLKRLGLGDKPYSFHSAPMTFPISNRPIITSTIGGKMTRKEESTSWDHNIITLKTILKHHFNENGVIHTHSYERAKHIAAALKKFNIYLHTNEEVTDDVIQDWIKSKKRILISPTVTEGVDLKNDLCRFQIVLKIPYPHIGDSRVKYLLKVLKQWPWYYNEALISILQMYGRAVRSQDDYANFFILDGSFNDLLKKCSFPDWFLDAFQSEFSFQDNFIEQPQSPPEPLKKVESQKNIDSWFT